MARCWTLAYGVMLSREWGQKIPASYVGEQTLHGLRDEEPPALEGELSAQVERYVEGSVETVRRLVFPVHGA